MTMKTNKLTRRHDWEHRLNLFFEKKENEPFRWGKNDCCLFAAHAIRAMTDDNPIDKLITPYHSSRQAYRIMQRITNENDLKKCKEFVRLTAQAIAALYDIEESKSALLRRGDIALVQLFSNHNHPTQQILGVVDLSGVTIQAISFQGMTTIPIKHAIGGWRI